MMFHIRGPLAFLVPKRSVQPRRQGQALTGARQPTLVAQRRVEGWRPACSSRRSPRRPERHWARRRGRRCC
eukprot:5760589-Pyramimonas_sp.AAC.1